MQSNHTQAAEHFFRKQIQLLSPQGTFDLMGEPGASLNTYMQQPNYAADTLSRQPDKQPLGYFK